MNYNNKILNKIVELANISSDFDNIASSTIHFMKNGGIHIKKKNRGKFTEYCGGKVTNECIQRGKHSTDPKIRKRATFAENARK